MANTNAPCGFRAIKSLTGAEVRVAYYKVASGSSQIGQGDLVAIQSNGYIQRETSATAVGPWVGVSLAATPSTNSTEIANHPVCTDPFAIYEVQASTAALATTDIGTIVQVDCSSAPDSNTGISKNVLTATAATASNGVRILRFVPAPDNAVGASARVEVILNSNQITPGNAGI